MSMSSAGASSAGAGVASGASLGTAIMPGWGTLIGGVGGAVLGGITGNSAAKKQAQAINEYNQKLAENATNNYQRIDIQEKEAAGDARNQLLDNNVSMAEQRAKIESIAAATGTAGGTLGTLINDVYAEGGRNQGTIVENYNREMTGYTAQALDVQKGAQAAMRSTKIQKPTAGELLSIGASTLTSTYQGVKAAKAINAEIGSKWLN